MERAGGEFESYRQSPEGRSFRVELKQALNAHLKEVDPATVLEQLAAGTAPEPAPPETAQSSAPATVEGKKKEKKGGRRRVLIKALKGMRKKAKKREAFASSSSSTDTSSSST